MLNLYKDKLSIRYCFVPSFHKNQTVYSRNVLLKINGKKKLLSEYDFIRLLVSLLRVYEEIQNFNTINPNNDIQTNTCESVEPRLYYRGGRATITWNNESVATFDVSILYNLTKSVYKFLNKYYSKDKIDFRWFSPIYLERMLGVDIPYLYAAEILHLRLSELRVFSKHNNKGELVENGRYYLYLNGKGALESIPLKSNYIGESNETRLLRAMECIKKYGYPHNNSYIIVYNNDKIIRDGEHRVSCLLYLYGDITIPVINLSFSHNYYSYSMYEKLQNLQEEYV